MRRETNRTQSTAEMKPKKKSTIDSALRWDEPEEEGARCRKHVSSSQPPYSVCPSCLYDRLIRLCPDCAHVRPCPCPCVPSTSASSASSSFSSATGSGRGTNGSSIGGGSDKISNLIASEPAFARSKSAGFALMRSGSVGIGVGLGLGLDRSKSVATGTSFVKKKRWRWAAIWPFRGLSEKGEDSKKNEWKWWYFSSPIRVFTHRKSVS